MGKSNLLDAIYYMSFCKSFTGMTDAMLMRSGETFLTAKAIYNRKGQAEELTLGMASGRRKSLKRGGKEYDRLSRHIGTFPLVLASPADIDLIRGPGEERRRWMDMVISQSDSVYLDYLIRYNAGLEQRNRLLRAGIVDHTLYEAIEMAMSKAAIYISKARREWIEKLGVLFHQYYAEIAETGETVALKYKTSIEPEADSIIPLLDNARRHDEVVGYTSVGIHRDDIELSLMDMPVKRAASQGQCKTFTTALRLAQYDFLKTATGMKPILLLDDIFDKLDRNRVERIMRLVTSDRFGQIFVTDTNREHLDEIISHAVDNYKLWGVDNGAFTEI